MLSAFEVHACEKKEGYSLRKLFIGEEEKRWEDDERSWNAI